MAKGYRFIDHTGDIGIIVHADELSGLFEQAARAMFEIIAELEHVHPKQASQLDIDASDLQALMVRWLSELNYRHITEEKLFCRFQIQEISPNHLHAQIFGESIDPHKHKIYTEIKAVTFHGLQIRQTADGFEAQIIFDV